MNTTSDFERRAAAFMADGPTELSDRVLEAALREVHEINQRRRWATPWRKKLMPTTFRLAAAVTILALVIGAGAYLSTNRVGPKGTLAIGSSPSAPATPAPSDSAAPIGTTAWSTFVSKRYGLQFGVPPNWTVVPAHRSGPGIAADEADSPGKTALFRAASSYSSQAFDESTAWTAYEATLGSAPTGCDPREPNAFSTMLVDGHFAHLFDVRVECGYGRAVVITGGRIYELTAIPRFQGDAVGIDHALFMAWLGTVHLDPAAANDSLTDPLDTSLWATFASGAHGYDALASVDWGNAPATRAATPEDLTLGTDDTAWDVFRVADGVRIDGISFLLPSGMTPDAWTKAYRDARVTQLGAQCVPSLDSWQTVTVDGHQGDLFGTCTLAASMILVGDRAYVFEVYLSRGARVLDEDRTLLRLFLSAVQFHPEAAIAPGSTVAPN